MAERKRSRIRRVVLIFFGVLLLAVVVGGISALMNPGITVSPETTFITGPLREDGSVDYLAALNELCSKGVTPENNAVVLLLEALGPGEISEPLRGRYCRMLDIEPPSDEVPHLERFDAYFERTCPDAAAFDEKLHATRAAIATRQYDEILTRRPWTEDEFPVAAAWLAENDPHLDLVVAASKRPRFYCPLVSSTGPGPELLIMALLPLAQGSRGAASALRARAMYRLGAGSVDEAWQDLLACHRLARLVDQGPTLVESLVGFAIDAATTASDAALAHAGKLTAEQARRFAADLAKLPPFGRVADKVNIAERFMFLDTVTAGASAGAAMALHAVPVGPHWHESINWAATATGKVFVDWNEPMRMGNQWYDRLVAALSKPTRRERVAALKELDRDVRPTVHGVKDLGVLWRNIWAAGSLRGGVGRQAGALFVALLLPALGPCATAEDRAVVMRDMAQVVFALAACRADHGGYPSDLAALVPKYLPAVPQDLFSDGPLRYRCEGAGYVLYSVGPNGKDDAGRNHTEEPDVWDAREWDDIAIRVPAKE